MKKITLVYIFLFFQLLANAQKEWKVYSPDRSLSTVLPDSDGRLSYEVLSGQDAVVRQSSSGIETNTANYSNHPSFVKCSSEKIDEQYTLNIGKRKENHATRNETSIVFKQANA